MTGEKVLTEEGRFFLEQTATLYPKLKKFLDEQKKKCLCSCGSDYDLSTEDNIVFICRHCRQDKDGIFGKRKMKKQPEPLTSSMIRDEYEDETINFKGMVAVNLVESATNGLKYDIVECYAEQKRMLNTLEIGGRLLNELDILKLVDKWFPALKEVNDNERN